MYIKSCCKLRAAPCFPCRRRFECLAKDSGGRSNSCEGGNFLTLESCGGAPARYRQICSLLLRFPPRRNRVWRFKPRGIGVAHGNDVMGVCLYLPLVRNNEVNILAPLMDKGSNLPHSADCQLNSPIVSRLLFSSRYPLFLGFPRLHRCRSHIIWAHARQEHFVVSSYGVVGASCLIGPAV